MRPPLVSIEGSTSKNRITRHCPNLGHEDNMIDDAVQAELIGEQKHIRLKFIAPVMDERPVAAKMDGGVREYFT